MINARQMCNVDNTKNVHLSEVIFPGKAGQRCNREVFFLNSIRTEIKRVHFNYEISSSHIQMELESFVISYSDKKIRMVADLCPRQIFATIQSFFTHR